MTYICNLLILFFVYFLFFLVVIIFFFFFFCFFFFFFFFFQAEDGIRDDLVTGVQTCALPISGWYLHRLRPPWVRDTIPRAWSRPSSPPRSARRSKSRVPSDPVRTRAAPERRAAPETATRGRRGRRSRWRGRR